MQTVLELGEAVAARRRSLGLKQGEIAARAGVPQESLSRFERGKLAEFGSRKLLAVLAAPGMELTFVEVGVSGSLACQWPTGPTSSGRWQRCCC